MDIVMTQGPFAVERKESRIIVRFPYHGTITNPEGEMVPHIPAPVPPSLRGGYSVTTDRAVITICNVANCVLHVGMGDRTIEIPLTGRDGADSAESTAHAILALLCLAHDGEEAPSPHDVPACPIRFIHMPEGFTTVWGHENGLPRLTGLTRLDPVHRAEIHRRLIDVFQRNTVDPSIALEDSVIAVDGNAHLSRLTEMVSIAWAAIGAELEIYLPIIAFNGAGQAEWRAAAAWINAQAAALEPTWGETVEDRQYWDEPDGWWIIRCEDNGWYIE